MASGVKAASSIRTASFEDSSGISLSDVEFSIPKSMRATINSPAMRSPGIEMPKITHLPVGCTFRLGSIAPVTGCCPAIRQRHEHYFVFLKRASATS